MIFAPAPGALPPGTRVYAIGDIHGCDDRLAVLHRLIAEDVAARKVVRPMLVHLGDYVDRGPDSAGVVARVAGPAPGRMMVVNLMGNHEHTMLEALDGHGGAATDWLFTGGRASLASWGIDPDAPRQTWISEMPPAQVAFLRNLPLSHREGGYFFVHAGVRPGVALEQQMPADMLSIRMPFLYSEQDFGAVVVHGHTPVDAPVVKANRIGIDTGAVFGGTLTCAVLENDKISFITA